MSKKAQKIEENASSDDIKRDEVDMSSDVSTASDMLPSAKLVSGNRPSVSQTASGESSSGETASDQSSSDQSSSDKISGANAINERGGPKGPEPTRFGDWENNGRCTDF